MDPALLLVLGAAALTALMTGVGALPFLLVPEPGRRALGWSNAAASGLMLAAGHALTSEGLARDGTLTLAGMLLGLAAIAAANRLLADADAVEVADLRGGNALDAILILGIMTAHSFAEGVGVGVAFAGSSDLAAFVTTAIAFHNVPEGLAIALVLIPRGAPVWKAAAWGVFTSLPQPLMALPAFLFVDAFRPLLPVGLGFAAGAMVWMVFSELFPQALERVDGASAATVLTLAFAAMLGFQLLLPGT